MPHFITRQIFTGAGKVGTEAAGLTSADVPFQLTQRADFFEEEVGLETTLKRPIVNTRDEPHADAQKYRRLHVIVGDANLSEVATFLKVGTTALVLSMIEDDCLARDLAAGPAGAGAAPGLLRPHAAPADRAGRRHDRSPPSRSQWELYDRARKYAEEHGLDCVGGDEVGGEVLRRWEAVLTGLETDPCTLADQVDWVAKHRLIDGYRERHDLRWDDARLAAMDLQYHDLRPEQVAGRPGRPRADRRPTTRSTAAMTEPPARHPGLLPGPVPAALAGEHRGGQLGLARVRRRWRSAAPGADDGTAAWNRGPRG